MEPDLQKLIAEKVNKSVHEQIAKLLREGGHSKDLAEIIPKLDLDSIQENVVNDLEKCGKPREKPEELWSDFNLDYYNYATIIENLNSTSAISKLKALDELLNIQLIDTKSRFWDDLSQCLRKCFVSANSEIYLKTLRIHHRILVWPNTCCDGFLSLLQGTLALMKNRNFGEITKNRALKALNLVLNGIKICIKSLLHCSHNKIDDIISLFCSVISFKAISDSIGALDPRASWVEKLCFGSYIRKSFFHSLKDKATIQIFVQNFLNLDSGDSGKFYFYFIVHFLSYNSNLRLLPLQLNETRVITLNQILETLLVKAKENNELTALIIDLFNRNGALLNQKILNLLIQPFNEISSSNVLKLVEINTHTIVIINNLAKSKHFRILFINCNKIRKSRKITRASTNFPQKIIDLTTIYLENSPQETGDISLLLHCCKNIYQSHSATLYYINPIKLVMTLIDFYKVTKKFEHKLEILDLFNYFYSNYPQIIKTIGWDNQILLDLTTFQSPKSLQSTIVSISNDKTGYEFLKISYNQLIKTYLEKLWYLDEKPDCCLTDSFDEFTVTFLYFIYAIKLNYKAIMAFLEENESTVIESDDKSVVLIELIEKGLNNGFNTVEELVGLLVVKVLTMDLDLMLYFQANHQIQEKLINLQDEAILNGGNTELIIDIHSILRQNILISFESVGFVDSDIDRDLLEMTELRNWNKTEIVLDKSGTNELKNFLTLNPKHHDFGWMLQARRAFKNSLHLFNPCLLTVVLEQIPKTYVYRKVDLNWPPPDSVHYQLHPEDFTGISTIINYGLELGLLPSTVQHKDTLSLLIKQSRTFLGHQPEEFNNFDWFVGIIYLFCSDDKRCKDVLVNFSNNQVTSLLWNTFGKEFDVPVQENFFQQLPIVLEENCLCFQALKVLGINCESLVQSWIKQCFFNILPLEEIFNLLIFSVLYPPECMLYYMTAIFKHLNDRICINTHSKSISNILNMINLADFRLKDYIEFIEKLIRQYRNMHKL